ncbi:MULTISPECIES: right-handed parallel beta-helix repeat-containing protein [Flavobacterium]|uniref:right-handed parallel beta-helix repeat-containing protein n=1 Tax=Flavobacterium TaxID=237 RepID=UPI00211577CF|nr:MULTISPECIES: right-handed parallel beta-helix repeat-containing protein [Flavobacterium]UUF12480.1 right-handed parallel beta-helix repeat-containing protein [Flavobacterium panici]
MNKIQKIIIILILLCSKALFGQTTFYVAPKGNDTSEGTKTKPFATISKAIAEARKISGNVDIYLKEGTFYLHCPIVFTAEDSRKQNEKLTIKNFDNQKVTISGSEVLNLNWKPYKNGIWQAKVAENLIFDQLFVNGKIQRMARYPNFDSRAQYYNGSAADAVSKERASLWKSPEGGYVHALHSSKWGDYHYLIKGKDKQGELVLEGGWQNNRQMGMHNELRFVENIFEELDTINEWFYNKKTKVLYYYPPNGQDIKKAKFETPQIPHLIEFKGSETKPVKNIDIEGVTLTQTVRTFMDNKEPLLRSDWTIYRGGAVFYDGAVNCSLKNCTLSNLGSNAVFFNNYNRNCEVSGCLISEIGASAFCFVGDPNAVRSPSFQYYQYVPLDKMDRMPGPKTNNYPAECKVYDNLMFDLGTVEKQSAGVQLSMCQNITVSHNTIYDIPRAGVNINEGTWGGHIIEYNDIFNTVKETGDHGSFNSWGRDRYWHPDKKVMDSIVENNYKLALADVVKPIVIQNNRMRCDHGWDIDLDDGSGNYIIRNNLCLNGGIKLREGVNRVVENNILVNNTFHPHVWFKNSNDVFKHNIVFKGYEPISIEVWGKETDYNVFPDLASLVQAQARGTDQHSVYGGFDFVNPEEGDFRLKEGSIAFSVGFKNFPMNNFGIISTRLKTLSKKVSIPKRDIFKKNSDDVVIDFLGAKVKNLNTLGESSATGMDDTRGVLVLEVAKTSEAAKFLQVNDVILTFNKIQVNSLSDLLEAYNSHIDSKTEVVFFRNQKKEKKWVELKNKK